MISRVVSIGIGMMTGLLLISASCQEVPAAEPEMNVPGPLTNGVVTLMFAKEGCDILIESKQDGKKVYYIPIDLQEKYKVEGMKIAMTYHVSRVNQGSCLKGHPIIIDSIEER